jgi:tetratricopeptide (TPR) repeat protein
MWLRPTLIPTLLSLLLVGAPAGLAQDPYNPPTGSAAGGAAEIREEAREDEASEATAESEKLKEAAEPAEEAEGTAETEPAATEESAEAKEAAEAEEGEPKKRLLYPISKRVSRYLAASLKLMQENKLDDAKALLQKIGGMKRLNPAERAKIEQFMGNVAIYKSDMPGGAKHLSQALSYGGLDLASEQQVTFQLASLYAQIGDFPKAMQTLDRWFAAAAEPTPEAFYLKAVILIQMQRLEEAVAAAEQAVSLTPDPREGWLSLQAHAYFLVKDYPKMAATLERLIVRSPTKKSYWLLLSAAYFELDRDEDARSIVQLAYRQGLLDQDREVRALARLLLSNGLPYEAAKVIEKGMADAVVPAQKDTYELLTNAFLQAREGEQALEPLAKGADLAEDAQLYMLLGKVHLQGDRYQEAVAALNQGLAKAKPEQRGRVYLLIGVAQLAANRLDDAEVAFRSAARGDEKVRTEAESYIKFVTQERARRREMGA